MVHLMGLAGGVGLSDSEGLEREKKSRRLRLRSGSGIDPPQDVRENDVSRLLIRAI